MNKRELKMLDLLKQMRDEDDIIAVKAEFEAEGSRDDELVMLNQIIFRADMELYIKIGGCEAVTDLNRCKKLGAAGIMAPMIETPFAMQKFIGAADKVFGDRRDEIEWIINAETRTCHENLDAILEKGKGFLRTVSIGRVDLSGSMGLTRAEINGDFMLENTMDIAKRSRAAGYIVNFGGGISFDAIDFIKRLYPLNDRFETRKIVFRTSGDEQKLKKKIFHAMEFEALYLQNKCEYYDGLANEDKARMKMMQERIEEAKARM
jgi:hypothetical protein